MAVTLNVFTCDGYGDLSLCHDYFSPSIPHNMPLKDIKSTLPHFER